MVSAKERLLAFEMDGSFLFHGSPFLVKELIPKQPTDFNKKTGKVEKDGNPCVAATPVAEIAIFRAITHRANFSGKGYASSFGTRPGGYLHFAVTRKLWKQLDGKIGYVYVLSRSGCLRFSPIELRFEQKVRPLEVIAVSAEDLPNNIKVKWWL